jgi:hypothetical protein
MTPHPSRAEQKIAQLLHAGDQIMKDHPDTIRMKSRARSRTCGSRSPNHLRQGLASAAVKLRCIPILACRPAAGGNWISFRYSRSSPSSSIRLKLSGAVVALAGAIRWPIAIAMIWASAGTLALAERCQLWPRAGLALLDVGEWCSRVARRMLQR